MRAAIRVDALATTRRGGGGGRRRTRKAPLSRSKRRRVDDDDDQRRKRSRCKAKSSFSSCQVWDVIAVREKKSGCAFLATVETVLEDGRMECLVLERERARDDEEAVYVETTDSREIAREDVVAVVSDSLVFSQRMESDRVSNPHGEHSTNIWVAEKSTADAIERELLAKHRFL